MIYLVLLALVGVLVVLRRQGKSAGALLCVALFCLYLCVVASYTLFYLVPVDADELRRIQRMSWSRNITMIPSFVAGDFSLRSQQVYGNFLLGMPFGFGLPFVTAHSTLKRVAVAGLGFAAGIEVAQLLIGLLVYHGPYRVIDIDDVWLVFTGVLAGYSILWVAARIYQRLGWERGARLPVWEHLHHVLVRIAQGRSRLPIAARAEDGK